MKSPEEITSIMLEKDAFSIWLGIEIISIKEGFCELTATVKEDMLNGDVEKCMRRRCGGGPATGGCG